ncbi:hypothetical protein BD410DRAFT_805188 [Rickenella mellea]|uniref:Uncharacterized protein n=1 Tax=Rickenella mellea TaxID=50990 RepID=A0A4Y7Q042_9AGAM|nr:hypothetical protein BD410DRAFT_805188 [Rickenella mellea]
MTLSSSSPPASALKPGMPGGRGEDVFKGLGFAGDAQADGGGGMRSPVDENGYKFLLNKFCFYTGRDASFLDIPQHQHQHQHADMMRRSYSASSVEELTSLSPFPPSSPSSSSSPMSSHPSSPFPSDINGSTGGNGMGGGTGQSTPTRASSFDSIPISGSDASFSGVVTPRQRFGSFGYLEAESPRAVGDREREYESEGVSVRG